MDVVISNISELNKATVIKCYVTLSYSYQPAVTNLLLYVTIAEEAGDIQPHWLLQMYEASR